MKVNGIEQLNLLLNLYFSRFAKKTNSYGTIPDIAKELGNLNGYTKSFLRSLKKEEILYCAHTIEVKGRFVETYLVDRDKLIEFLKKCETFKKMYAVVHDRAEMLVPDLYPKSELKEIIT